MGKEMELKGSSSKEKGSEGKGRRKEVKERHDREGNEQE